jgi:hypothetical protein
LGRNAAKGLIKAIKAGARIVMAILERTRKVIVVAVRRCNSKVGVTQEGVGQ